MKFLMISVAGEGAGILQRLQDEGNEVKLFIQEDEYRSVYDGLVPKTDDIDPSEDEIILFDSSGSGELADDLQLHDYKTFGGSQLADDLEHDRQFGLDTMKKYGIRVPLTQEFEDFEDTTDFLKQHKNKRFVFKPSGDSLPCKLTYCSEDNEDLVNYMKFVAEKFSDDIESFVLQEFIEGDLVSSEIFCDGNKIVGTANHSVEKKKFMNDDLGPSTGCSGNIVWIPGDSKIIENGVLKVSDCLTENHYVGQIDLNAIVNETGIYGLEWTPRFGYDSMPTFMSMLDMEYGKFFSDIVNGQSNGDWEFKLNSCAAVRLSIPPYPVEPSENAEDIEDFSPNIGVPIQGWETFAKNLYFYEVMYQDDVLCHAGGTGLIALAIHKNASRCVEILDKLKVPDKQYRTDLPKILEEMKRGAMQWQ